jgi:hypothetical protein
VILVAIDTCVFEHYLNLTHNSYHHIDQLLAILQRRKAQLCVDNNDRIQKEYSAKIEPMILSRDEGGIERYTLTYWMTLCPRNVVAVDETDYRMASIKREITENEQTDRAFVYVACASDCKLVTNDDTHIISRRTAIRKATKKYRGDNTDFVSSSDAAVHFGRNGE